MIKTDKATWFRSQGATATIMIPWTENSSLARKLRTVLEEFRGPKGTSVKVVEKPGVMVMTDVRSNKKFTRISCGRDKCPLRSAGKDCFDKCYQEGIIYVSKCNLCSEQGTSSVYIGETSRTLYTRSKQHYNDFKREINNQGNLQSEVQGDLPKSWIRDHMREKHHEETEDNPEKLVSFEVISNHPDPFSRQTVEAVQIQEALNKQTLTLGRKTQEISSLNRKGEYFCAKERWDSRRNNL